MIPITWFAAQSADKGSRLLADVLPWLILLIGVIIAGGIAIYWIRRSFRSDQSSLAHGFTLQELRQMHAAGDLTDEQFERAKAMMIGRLKAPDDQQMSESQPGNHKRTSN
jgi:uncharacterized membrane protein